MAGAAEFFGTRKIGPRAITFLGGSPSGVLSNCRNQVEVVDQDFVLGEDGTFASLGPLVHGTYILRVVNFPNTFRVAVAQLNPRDADADPLVVGFFMQAGESFEFFVDDSLIDGIIKIVQCGAIDEETCNGVTIPLATVNRLVTTLPMSVTGDTASPDELRPSKAPATTCGGLIEKA